MFSLPSAVLTTNAVPSTGWPANGSSDSGARIRIQTSPPSAWWEHKDRLGEVHLARQALHLLRRERTTVDENSELVSL
jgi:hypothetical protein